MPPLEVWLPYDWPGVPGPLEVETAITQIPLIVLPEESVTVPDMVSPAASEALMPVTGVEPTVTDVALACELVPEEVPLYHWAS